MLETENKIDKLQSDIQSKNEENDRIKEQLHQIRQTSLEMQRKISLLSGDCDPLKVCVIVIYLLLF